MQSTRTKQEEFKEKTQRIFTQITEGCGYASCRNPYCTSTPLEHRHAALRAANLHSDRTAAATLSLQLAATLPVHEGLCPTRDYPRPLQLAELEALIAANRTNHVPIVRRIGEVFGSAQSLRESFYASTPNADHEPFTSADLEQAQAAYTKLASADASLPTVASSAVSRVLSELRARPALLQEPATLRALAIAFEQPCLSDPESFDALLGPLATCVAVLPSALQTTLAAQWAAAWSGARLRQAVLALQAAISTRVLLRAGPRASSVHGDAFVTAWCVLLAVLHESDSAQPPEQRRIVFAEWYNSVLCESIDIREDYVKWRFAQKPQFSFCRFPFVLEPSYKSKLLQIESALEQQRRRQDIVSLGPLALLGPPPFLLLRVRREHLLHDSLLELQRCDTDELKKELRVQFRGEEGLDYGGVQKEWFQLLVEQLFDARYGMFVWCENTRVFWLDGNSDALADFTLVGMLLGLSVYNGVILDVKLPQVLYKKLKGIVPDFEDLRQTHPQLHAGLLQLLQCDAQCVQDIGAYFVAQHDRYGQVITQELVSGGSDVAVTAENRHEYVRLMTKHLLVDSVAPQFDAFYHGFRMLCNSEAFDLFIAEELELVICGNPELDWLQLQRTTRYDGGFTAEHPTVKCFWDVFHNQLSVEQKKLFLRFTTGSDRCPVGGLGQLRMVITRHGPDTDRLPTSSTCFNHFLLPEYSSAHKLQEKLLQAIQNSTGFGLL